MKQESKRRAGRPCRITVEHDCYYAVGVICKATKASCTTCSWNPEVLARRKEKIREEHGYGQ